MNPNVMFPQLLMLIMAIALIYFAAHLLRGKP
jgi:hypothetical protein